MAEVSIAALTTLIGSKAVATAVFYMGVNMALSLAARAIFKPRSDTSINEGRKDTIRSNVEFRRIVYGEDLVSGPLLFAETTNSSNKFLHLVVVLAGHPIEEYIDIYLNDIKLEFDQDINSGDFLDAKNEEFESKDYGSLVKCNVIKGIKPEEVEGIKNGSSIPYALQQRMAQGDLSSQFGIDHLAVNCPTVYVRLEYDREAFGSGIPHVRAKIKGKNDIYDPRTDTVGYSDNWALCTANYITDKELGYGADSDRVVWKSVADAADTSDELVKIGMVNFNTSQQDDIYSYERFMEDNKATLENTVHDSFSIKYKTNPEFDNRQECTHQRRYTVNGTLYCADSPADNLESLLACAMGSCPYTQGSYELFAGEFLPPEENIDPIVEEDFIGDSLLIKSNLGRTSRQNIISGTYIMEDDLHASGEFPSMVPKVLVDFEIVTFDLEIPTVTEAEIQAPSSNYQIGDVFKYSGDFIVPETGNQYVIFVLQESDSQEGISSVGWVRYIRLSEGDNPYQVEDNGEELETTVEFPLISNKFRAERIAKLMLDLSRQSVSIEGELNMKALQYKLYRNVPVTLDRAGWKDKVFKVDSWEFNPEGKVRIALREDNPRIYQWKQGEAIIGGNRDNTNLGLLPRLPRPENIDGISTPYYSSDNLITQLTTFIKPDEETPDWAVRGYSIETMRIVRGLWHPDIASDIQEAYQYGEFVAGSFARNAGGTNLYICKVTGSLLNPAITGSGTDWWQLFYWYPDVGTTVNYFKARAYLDCTNNKFYVLKGTASNEETRFGDALPPNQDDRFEEIVPRSGETWNTHGLFHSDLEIIETSDPIIIGDKSVGNRQGFLKEVSFPLKEDRYIVGARALANNIALSSFHSYDNLFVQPPTQFPSQITGIEVLNLVEAESGPFTNGFLVSLNLSNNNERNISHFLIEIKLEATDDTQTIEYTAPKDISSLTEYRIFIPSTVRSTITVTASLVNNAGDAGPSISSPPVEPLPEGARLRGIWEAGIDYEEKDIVFLEPAAESEEFLSILWICKVAHTSEVTNKPGTSGGDTFWDSMLNRTPQLYVLTKQTELNNLPDLVNGDQLLWRGDDGIEDRGATLYTGGFYVWDGNTWDRQTNTTFIQQDQPLTAQSGDVWIYTGNNNYTFIPDLIIPPGATLRKVASGWIISSARTFIDLDDPIDNTISEAKEGDYWKRTNLDGTIPPGDPVSGPAYGTLSVRSYGAWRLVAEAGLNGQSIVELFLFSRSSNKPTKPIEGVWQYDFATNIFTDSGGTDATWKTNVEDSSMPAWVSIGTANSKGDPEALVDVINWSDPVKAFVNGENGRAVNIVFRKDTNTPTKPDSSQGVPSSPQQWYDTAGQAETANSNPDADMYSSVGTRTDPDADWQWQDPIKMTGPQGVPGTPGSNGDTLAEVFAFKRAASFPGNPPEAVFNFDTGNLEFTGTNGEWSVSVPSSGTGDVWAAVGIAKNPEGTTHPTNAVPVVWKGTGRAFADGVEGPDGEDGVSIDAVFRRHANPGPDTPTDPNNPPQTPDSWVTSVNNVGTGDDPIWVSVGKEQSNGDWSWEAPVKLEGRDGAQGPEGPPGSGPLNATATGSINFTAVSDKSVSITIELFGRLRYSEQSISNCPTSSELFHSCTLASNVAFSGTTSTSVPCPLVTRISEQEPGFEMCSVSWAGDIVRTRSISAGTLTKGQSVSFSVTFGNTPSPAQTNTSYAKITVSQEV